mmetsp:Transcript_29208/g.52183  ORF Transcript_29208/g.52183 Transcript_29208/m.52183 type:complete len:186 (-) Transcript_29208:6-563(-)
MPYNPKDRNCKICCTLCGKELMAGSLRDHYIRFHPRLCESETQAKQPYKSSHYCKVECPLCKSQLEKKSLKTHVRDLHPAHIQEFRKLIREAEYIEGPFSKRRKMAEESQETAVDTDDNSANSSRCSLKCACGITFKTEIYFQVHETLFHRNLSSLKRCEYPGCFGLLLREELYTLHYKVHVNRE